MRIILKDVPGRSDPVSVGHFLPEVEIYALSVKTESMSFNKTKALQTASKLVQQGRHKAAIEEYREILRNDPQDVATMNVFGDLCARAGNTAEAVSVFVRIADKYIKQDSMPRAIAMLRKAIKLSPDNTDVGIKLATLYSRQNLHVEAQQQYLVVADQLLRQGRRDEAFSFYENLIKTDASNTALQVRVAEAYLRVEKYDRAGELFVAAAEQFQDQLKHEEALKTWLQALKAKPDDRRALTAAINIYLRRAETRPAETLLRHMLRTSPDDPAVLNLLARVHQVGHDLEIARQAISGTDEPVSEYLQHQVELVSACGRAYATFFTAAGELERQGKYEEALQNYLKALRIKPESRPATIAAVNIYLHRNEAQLALKLIRHLLQMLPDDAELLSLLGRIYSEAQDYEAALQAVGRAVTLDAARYQELLHLAVVLAQGGDAELTLRALDYVSEILSQRNEEGLAVPVLHQILARHQHHPGALERLAAIYRHSGDTPRLNETLRLLAVAARHHSRMDLAIQSLREMVELEPHAEWPRQQLRELGCQIEDLTSREPSAPVTEELPEIPAGDFPSSLVMLLDEPETMAVTAPAISAASPDKALIPLPHEAGEMPVAYFPTYNRYNSLMESAVLTLPREEAPEDRAVSSESLPIAPLAQAAVLMLQQEKSQPSEPVVEESAAVHQIAEETPAEVSCPEITAESEAPGHNSNLMPTDVRQAGSLSSGCEGRIDETSDMLAACRTSILTDHEITEDHATQSGLQADPSSDLPEAQTAALPDFEPEPVAAAEQPESPRCESFDEAVTAVEEEFIFPVTEEVSPLCATQMLPDESAVSLPELPPEVTTVATAAATAPIQVVFLNFDLRPQFPTHWRWPGRTMADRRREAPRPTGRRASGRNRRGRRSGR